MKWVTLSVVVGTTPVARRENLTLEALISPLRVLVDPVGGVERAVESRRWVFGVVAVSVLSAASGAALALKLDASQAVVTKLALAGELAKASEREIADAIQQAERVALVAGVAKGLFLAPLTVLALAVALKLAGWLLERRAAFVACLSAASLATLPVAVYRAVQLAAALRQGTLTPKTAESLVPSSLAHLVGAAAPWDRVLGALDVINLWSALVLGLGFAAASRWNAWKGALFGLVLYVLFACAFLIGLPGLVAGGPGLGGPPP